MTVYYLLRSYGAKQTIDGKLFLNQDVIFKMDIGSASRALFMKSFKVAFVLLILIMLFVIGVLLYKNRSMILNGETLHEALNSAAHISLKFPHFIEMNGEVMALEVKADEAYYYKENNLAHLKKPRARLYREDGNNTAIRGDEGIIDTETNNVDMTGNVEIDTVEGYYVETSSAKYENDKMLISTDADVKFTGKGFEIKGKGMTISTDKDILRIHNNVKAVFYSLSGDEHVENKN